MIRSFADRETEKVFHQTFSRKLPQTIQSVALRKLIMIDNAGCLEDLRVPPANRLEKLDGDRRDNTAFGSMISTESALPWKAITSSMLKSLIITNPEGGSLTPPVADEGRQKPNE